jgi:allantoinase
MAACDLLIRGGTVVTPLGTAELEIGVAEGKIAELSPSMAATATEEIDARGLTIFPGLVDAHVHFNEPGRAEWEGFATGSAALAAGGGTCFFDMPLNSSPPTLDAAGFDQKRVAGEASSCVDFALWGGLTPSNLDRMEELAERGVVGFKAFMCDSGMEDFCRADDLTLYRGMTAARRLGLPVAVHAESQEITNALTAEARTRGKRGWRDYVHSRPMVAEAEAIARAILLAEETGCALHVVHVSTARGVELVRRAAAEHGIDVTCETCPHYFVLNEGELAKIGAAAKCAPPLRSAEEGRKIWSLLGQGVIALVGSDHSPAPASMKQGEDAFAIWGGIAGVQSTLSAMLSGEPSLTPMQIGRLIASNVADRFGLRSKGRIAVGSDADLALVDTAGRYTVSREQLLDRNKLSPYVGREMRGIVRRTIARGQTVYLDGRIVGKTNGRLIRPVRDVTSND